MNPQISVIVPIYNSGKYIGRCVLSILNQTFSDFELILVDDGSSDNSVAICSEYAMNDNRIVVLSKENGGVSSARNLGINKARGVWIAFVDSDDYVYKDYLQNLHNGLGREYSDESIVIGNIDGIKRKRSLISDSIILEGADMRQYMLKNNIFRLSAPYAKLFNHKIIKQQNLSFPEGINMGEDMIFFGEYMNHVNRASFIQVWDYYVSDYCGSLSKKYYSFESEFKCFELWKENITSFVQHADLPESELERLIWENRTSETFLRCLETLCKYETKSPINDRLFLMKSLPSEYYSCFIKYHHPQSIKQKIIRSLIKTDMFRMFLYLGSFYGIINK